MAKTVANGTTATATADGTTTPLVLVRAGGGGVDGGRDDDDSSRGIVVGLAAGIGMVLMLCSLVAVMMLSRRTKANDADSTAGAVNQNPVAGHLGGGEQLASHLSRSTV